MRQPTGYGFIRARTIGLAFLLALAAGRPLAQTAGMNRSSYEGSLGASRIGMTLIVQGAGTIAGGHYYYAKYLTDIPLTGSLEAGAMTLKGQDGGTFQLKFVGNGSDGGKPLDFDNSVGLEGAWSKDGKTLPVKLSAGGVSAVPASGRWYEEVTDASDAAFEANVRGFYKAALASDRAAMARYVAFPLRVNRKGKSRYLNSAAELSAQWDAVFTPAYLAALKQDIPHELSIVKGQAMLGAGDAFFSDKGATALNLP